MADPLARLENDESRKNLFTEIKKTINKLYKSNPIISTPFLLIYNQTEPTHPSISNIIFFEYLFDDEKTLRIRSSFNKSEFYLGDEFITQTRGSEYRFEVNIDKIEFSISTPIENQGREATVGILSFDGKISFYEELLDGEDPTSRRHIELNLDLLMKQLQDSHPPIEFYE